MRDEEQFFIDESVNQINNSLKGIAIILNETYKLIYNQKPEGKTYFIDLHIAKGDKLIHLDFVKGDVKDGSKNVPLNREGVHVEYPYREIREVRVMNRGDATVVFAVNVQGRSSTRANIRVQKFDSHPFTMNYHPVLKNMNITLERESTQSADVEILLIV